jgi:hypothetical protein
MTVHDAAHLAPVILEVPLYRCILVPLPLTMAPPPHEPVSIIGLAAQVSKLSADITAYLDENKYPYPNFTSQSPTLPETRAFDALRYQITDTLHDLLRLVNGPRNTLRTMSFWHTDLAALQVALTRKFFACVPDDGKGLSASDIAQAASMDTDRASRVLKMLETHRIFEEADGRFRHTSSSIFLKTDIYRCMAEEQLDTCFKASCHMDEWIDADPGAEYSHSPFYSKYVQDFYQHHQHHPEKGKRFSDAMRAWGTSMYPCNIGVYFADIVPKSTKASRSCATTSIGGL